MPANNLHSTSLIDLTSQLSLQKKKKVRKSETTYDKVKRYTDVLMMSNDEAEIDNALMSLIQIDAHLLVFDSHKVESILTEEYDGYDDYQYLVNRLKKRIAMLREEDKKKMEPNKKKKDDDDGEVEEEYDPKYPEIRSSVEMTTFKQEQSTSNSLESEEEEDAVCLRYTCLKKELKTEKAEDDDEESVEGVEEYDPEYPEIRSSVEMAMDAIPNISFVLAEHPLYGLISWSSSPSPSPPPSPPPPSPPNTFPYDEFCQFGEHVQLTLKYT